MPKKKLEAKDVIKNLTVEETPECSHKTFTEMIPGEVWYECEQCGMVVNMFSTQAYSKHGFKELTAKLNRLANHSK